MLNEKKKNVLSPWMCDFCNINETKERLNMTNSDPHSIAPDVNCDKMRKPGLMMYDVSTLDAAAIHLV